MENQNYQPVSMGDWLITFIITCLPVVGIVMLFVWAFGDGTHPSKKNWAKASLILALIILALFIILLIMFFSFIATMFGGMGAYS
jgi:heme/copper-type cytochrome/quinol oxidase subunit 2